MQELPHSHDLECSLLGAILIDPRCLEDVHLTPEDFYTTGNQHIFRAIINLDSTGQPVDLVTVSQWIKDKGQLEAVGGSSNIASLTNNPVTNPKHADDKIKDLSNRRKIITEARQLAVQAYDTGSDISEAVSAFDMSLAENSTTGDMTHVSAILPEVIDELEALYKGEIEPGIPTGFDGLPPMVAGDLIVIGGRPGMGKTAFAMDIIKSVIQKQNVAVFSFEMTKKQIVKRLLSQAYLVNSEVMRNGKFEQSDWGKLANGSARLNTAGLWVEKDSSMKTGDIRRMVSKRIRKDGLGLVVIDYLQQIQEGGESKRLEVAQITRNCKAMAVDFEIPVVLLAQVARRVEERPNPVPRMSDLLESGQIEQEADTIMLLYREEYYKKEDTPEDKRGKGEIIVEKNRHGPTFIKEIGWRGEYTSYVNLTSMWD